MQPLPDLSQLSHAQKDELIRLLWPLQHQVASLIEQVAAQAQRIQQLEGRLSLNSRNSSRPPSSDGLAKPAPKSLRPSGQKPNGGQKGHEGNTLRQSAHVDEILVHAPAVQCSACQQRLPEPHLASTRQVLQLPALAMRVIEHRQMRSVCRCGAEHLGRWPEGVTAPVQYGASVKAMAVHLNQHHLVPLARTAALMQELYGAHLSQASIQSFAQEAAQALEPTVRAIGLAVQGAAVVYADETGIRVKGALHWLHCAVTASFSWLGVHPKRGAAAIEALGVLKGVKGVLVHDGLASYKGLDCKHGLCNAHHIRELVYVHEQGEDKIWDNWAQQMIDLLRQALKEVDAKGAALDADRQLWYEARWSELLERGEALNPPKERRDTSEDEGLGVRGRLKQSKETNLLKRLREHCQDVWRFISEPGVGFTNNAAEQALRMAKVKQNISGCFRTVHGAHTFFVIRSYLATMRKQKVNAFECLNSVFRGHTIQPNFAA